MNQLLAQIQGLQDKVNPLNDAGDMTLVYCGSLASVRSRKPACPYRVSASCSTALHCTALFLAQICKHRLASFSRLLIVLAGANSSLSIEIVGDCLIFLPVGFALQPARVASYPDVYTLTDVHFCMSTFVHMSSNTKCRNA